MRTITPAAEHLISSISIVALLVCAASCNTLKEDPDLLQKPAVTGKEIYVSASGASVIDLTTLKVHTSVPVTVSVTSQPTQGSLSSLGNGLFQYRPTQLRKTLRDAFQFKVYGSNNEVLQTDSVVIIVETDTTKLPCGIYTNSDYIENASPLLFQTLDVISNDYICGNDSTNFELSIYGTPHQGTATAKANRFIGYLPDASFSGTDSIIYKIQSKSNPSLYAYGIVMISSVSSCQPSPMPDHFYFDYDSIQSTQTDSLKINLRVLDNDVICNGFSLQVLEQFRNGSAETDNIFSGYITYFANPIAPGQIRQDSMMYALCANSQCRPARVYVTITRR